MHVLWDRGQVRGQVIHLKFRKVNFLFCKEKVIRISWEPALRNRAWSRVEVADL